MSQHDYNLANQSGADFRADLNNALSAIATNNSGSSEPSTTFAYEWWVDTTNNLLKLRNSTNNAWITLPISVTADNTVDINGGTVNSISSFSFSSGSTVTTILDEDNLASNSATALATQQSIKAYVDSQVTAQDLDISDGSSSISIDLDSESLGLLGGTGLTSTASGNNVTFAIGQAVGTGDDVQFNQVTSALVGNASTATALATARAIALSGDVVGTANFDGTAGITISTTIQANSIALGTDTTGNYVATIAGTTNEIEVSGSGSETASVTVGLPDDVTIAGNLTVNGTTTTVNTSTLSVEDPLIKLANNNSGADSVDIGFYGLYDTSGAQDLYAGLFRDANDSGKFKLFKDLQTEPTTTVNTSGTGYAVGTLVSNLEGNITSTLTSDLNFADNSKAIFGTGNDLEIYHDGSNSIISDTGTGSLKLMSGAGFFVRTPADASMIDAQNGAAVSLYHNNSKKFDTTSTGVDISGVITTDGLTTSADINFGDNDKAVFGAGSDLEIYHDGSNSYIKDAGTGTLRILSDDVRIMNASGTEISAQFLQDGEARLKYDNSTKLATKSTGIDVTGVITTDGLTTSADINFGDNDKAVFGASSDLQLFHDGGNSFIREAGTGNLYIEGAGSIRFRGTTTQENLIEAVENGAVSLYHDNSVKIATSSTGVDVTGTTTSDGSVVSKNTAQGSGELQLQGYGGTAFINHSGANDLIFRIGSSFSEKMRLSQAGTFLVGKTAEDTATDGIELNRNDVIVATRNNDSPLLLNRRSSDGDIINFRKDNSAVGSIGTNSGYMVIGSPVGTDAHLLIGNGLIHPATSTGSTKDNAIDIGGSSNRFKDLHLSGTAYTSGITTPSGDLTLDVAGGIILDADGGDILLKDGGTEVGRFLLDDNNHLKLKSIQSDADILFQGNDGGSGITALRLDMSASGAATFNDQVTIGGNLVHAGNMTVDVAGDLTLDADGGDIIFADGGSEKARFTNGKLAIGNTSPQAKLHVTDGATILDMTDNGYGGLKITDDTSSDYNVNFITGRNQGNTRFNFYRGGRSQGTTPWTDATPSKIAHLSHSSNYFVGNTGIGTDSPNAPLSVVSASNANTIRMYGRSADNYSELYASSHDGGTNYAFLQGHSSQTKLATLGSTPLVLGTNGLERMRIDSSGRVGIGTSSPQDKLHVYDGDVGIENSSGRRYRLIAEAGGGFTIRDQTASASRLAIDTSGNVGIGTTSVGTKLHVVSGTDNNIATDVSEIRFIGADKPITGEQANLVIQTNDDMAADKGGSIGFGGRHTTSSTNGSNFAHISGRKENSTSANFAGYLSFGTADSASDIHERMRIDSSGNIGIGTSSPSAALHVLSPTTLTAKLQGATNAYIDFTDGSVESRIQNSGGLYIGTETNHSTNLKTNGSVRLSVGGTGNVGIGTSSPSSYYADNLVVSSDDDSGITLASSATTHKAFLAFADGTSGAEAYQGYLAYDHNNNSLQLGTSGSERARLDNAGNLLIGTTDVTPGQNDTNVGTSISNAGRLMINNAGADNIMGRNTDGILLSIRKAGEEKGNISVSSTATTYATSSDARLKDVTGTARGLEVINELNPVAYNWKADGKADEGLIAQEVKELVPNAVVGSEEDMYSMDYSKLVVHLVAGMKEQQEQMQTQQELIEDLQTQINNLRGK